VAHEVKPRDTMGQLPVMVVGPADVGRLIRELEAINNTIMEHTLRKSGQETKMLKTSQLMNQIAELNKLNLLHEADREYLRQLLQAIKTKAPVLHMSFSADPSTVFLGKLMSWLRQEIHPHVLLTIGLQPNIGAGCILRSANRYFDFSLRQDFAKKRTMLLGQLIPDMKKAKT
jgi:F0F1-type ATP synthase delta subunit